MLVEVPVRTFAAAEKLYIARLLKSILNVQASVATAAI